MIDVEFERCEWKGGSSTEDSFLNFNKEGEFYTKDK